MELFESKIRKVGTSFGVLIPKENAAKGKMKEGLKVRIAIVMKDPKLVEKMFGSVKAKPFRREHTDRAM